MFWITVIAISTAVAAIIILILERRQMRGISRQLRYIKENETNMIVTAHFADRTATELANEINALLKLYRHYHVKEIQRSERVKEELTGISHDIRTPLTSLSGYFELLKTAETDEEREKYCAVINDRIKSLSDLLEQTFMFAKLQNDSYDIEPEKCSLKDILCDSLLSFYEDFRVRGLEPSISVPENEIFIISNKVALRRIIQNVMKNALSYSREAPEIKLFISGREAIATFANTCDNLEEIDTERVFNRFYKADNSRGKNSTGLGLSIAKQLVEKTGGRISAVKSTNKFIIVLSYPYNPENQK